MGRYLFRIMKFKVLPLRLKAGTMKRGWLTQWTTISLIEISSLNLLREKWNWDIWYAKELCVYVWELYWSYYENVEGQKMFLSVLLLLVFDDFTVSEIIIFI